YKIGYPKNIKINLQYQMLSKYNSERSEECIDFTMIIISRNNVPISKYGVGFRYKSVYSCALYSFQKNREKQKKNDGKTRLFTQNTFSTKSNFFFLCRQKIFDDQKHLLQAKKKLKISSYFYEICRKCEHLQNHRNHKNQVFLHYKS
ncbi:hypothetical protein FWK35_00028973, partial [Aphis craccivora]